MLSIHVCCEQEGGARGTIAREEVAVEAVGAVGAVGVVGAVAGDGAEAAGEAAATTAEREWNEEEEAEDETEDVRRRWAVDRVGICPADAETRGHGWSWWQRRTKRRPGKAARTAGHSGGGWGKVKDGWSWLELVAWQMQP